MAKGFELNPYDICVENKMENGKQCTLVWYVDDKKVLHTESKVVEDLINGLKNHFLELVVSRGKKHTFFVMNINTM